MAGDVVQRAVEFGGGAFNADRVLAWLANIVRSLRTEASAACGSAGEFSTGETVGTVEINPHTRTPIGNYSSRTLVFNSSPALEAVLHHNALTDELLQGLAHDDPVAQAFGRALATELVLSRRAAIGNFGVWTIGQKPDLERFIRFRPRPVINRML